jgi:ribosomal RNA-processing protein 36
VQAQMSKVSFGALAKAHEALSKDQSGDRKRKRGEPSSQAQEDKLEALRARLRQIKADKMAAGAIDPSASKSKSKSKSAKPAEKSRPAKAQTSQDADSDSDAAPHARSSKHAPAVQSSKRMVSRKRTVVDVNVKKPTFRDPRFDAATGPRPDDNTLNKRYSFLNDYKASEIADLKRTIKKTKSEGEKEQLKKQLLSMESQQKARENKEQHQAVIREHKKKEKELVKDGKQPFFLKKCTSAPPPPLPPTPLPPPANLLHSRAKEARPHRQVPEHEVKAARQDHRAPSQEGHVQGAPEHACRATHRMSAPRWHPLLASLVGTRCAASRSNFTLSYRYPLPPCVLEQSSASRGIPLIRHLLLFLLLQREGGDAECYPLPKLLYRSVLRSAHCEDSSTKTTRKDKKCMC